jgi:hypothetical protein
MFKRGNLNVRNMLGALAVAAVGTVASVAWAAGGVSGATVSAIQLGTSTNTATVFFTPPLNTPSCQVSTAILFDHTTARGKSILTLLTSAQLSGKKVNLAGNGICTTISGLTWENLSTASMTNL